MGRYVGTEAFAGIGVAGSIMNLFIFILTGGCNGMSIIFAELYGQKNYEKLRKESFLSLSAGGGFTIVLSIVSLLVHIKDRMFFGSKQGNKKRQKDLQDILANARILTTIPDDIDLEIWKKFFMISTAATITSYFNETIGEVVNNHIDLFITLGYELKSVAEAKGIRLPDGQVFSAIDAQKIMPNNSTTSMHSDFQKSNRTEVETLTGYVVRTAQELGIEVPTYQFMYKGLTEFPYPMAD